VRGCLKCWPLLRVAVAEQSMLPALHPGDWLLAWRTTRIRPGQVVLAWHPERPGFLLVKRAVRRVEGDGDVGGGWWLASDNPAAGAVDSARFGPVREELIVGRVLGRYWPPRRARYSPELSRTDATDCVRPRPCERVRGPTVCRCNGVMGRT
jgi:nickel-type superoxide dismutase maturation protease